MFRKGGDVAFVVHELRAADAFAKGEYPEGARLCSKGSTTALIMMDGCKTCLSCNDTKCS